LIQQEEGRT